MLGEVCGFAGVGDEQYRDTVSRWAGGSFSVWVVVGHRPVLPGRDKSKRPKVEQTVSCPTSARELTDDVCDHPRATRLQ